MKKILAILLIFSISILFYMCKSTQKSTFEPNYKPGPPAIVYKTKKDYSHNVPVLLSDDKKTVTGYFGPSDLANKGEKVYPSILTDGYLLDNIGINQNVAYTSLTIENYSKSMQVFTAEKLYELIIDFDPLVEMYDCGNRSLMDNPVDVLNDVIINKQLKNCKKLK